MHRKVQGTAKKVQMLFNQSLHEEHISMTRKNIKDNHINLQELQPKSLKFWFINVIVVEVVQ